MTAHEDTNAVVDALRAWLGALTLGEPLAHDGLAVYPARAGDGRTSPLRYALLCQALASGQAVVSEKRTPTVPTLEIENHGDTPVLILSGEEVVGGLQNRIVSTTALLPPRTAWDIGVLCVEAGRWHPRPPTTPEDAEVLQPPAEDRFGRPTGRRADEPVGGTAFRYGGKEAQSLRRARHDWVTDHAGRLTSPVDQPTQWDALAAMQARAGVQSPTGAMRDVYHARADRLAAFLAALPYADGALGMVVGIGGQVVGADLFDQAHSAAVLWATLVESYALDALDEPASGPLQPDEARRFVARAAAGEAQVAPSLGLGTDVRLVEELVTGQSLVHDAVPAYTALYRRTRLAGPGRFRVQRFSGRRRRQLGG